MVKKSPQGIRVSEPKVFLFLYLLHHPDYPYNIHLKFDEATEEGVWNERRGMSSLKHANKVSALLKDMEKDGSVIQIKPKTGRPKEGSIDEIIKSKEGQRRIYYRVNPAILSTNLEREMYKTTDNFAERSYEHVVENYVKLIHEISPDKIACIGKIASIGEYNALSLLFYFRNLLCEIYEFVAHKYDMPAVSIADILSTGAAKLSSDCVRYYDYLVGEGKNTDLNREVNEKSSSAIELMQEKLEKLGYLFSWDNIPGDDNERLLKFLKDDLDIGWAENAEILKPDSKTVQISKDESSAEITIDEKTEKAILKLNDGRTRELKAKKENSKLNIYKLSTDLSPLFEYFKEIRPKNDIRYRFEKVFIASLYPYFVEVPEYAEKKKKERRKRVEKSFLKVEKLTTELKGSSINLFVYGLLDYICFLDRYIWFYMLKKLNLKQIPRFEVPVDSLDKFTHL